MAATVLVYVHFIIAALMIALIMLQQGKGSEMGASLGGGSSNTMFGAAGSMTFFTKATAVLATLFFITSFALALSARNQATIGFEDDLDFLALPDAVETPVQNDEIPSLEFSDDGVAPAGDIPAAPEF